MQRTLWGFSSHSHVNIKSMWTIKMSVKQEAMLMQKSDEMHHHSLGIRGWKLRTFQDLMMHWVGKCVISTENLVLAFNPWPVKHVKAIMWKLHISAHPHPAWIVPLPWDGTDIGIHPLQRRLCKEMKNDVLILVYNMQHIHKWLWKQRNIIICSIFFMIIGVWIGLNDLAGDGIYRCMETYFTSENQKYPLAAWWKNAPCPTFKSNDIGKLCENQHFLHSLIKTFVPWPKFFGVASQNYQAAKTGRLSTI